ncbi:uncharacterized protein LOC131676062 [Topomyia yanbarensis]|uniref:uncharacterized protein LOC131676062 n=1 Tax=Topomyia yanbarensis TaxID=2498891 RepID=UPI00273CD165|nr:uncharacterized protein LOC131676062 [Topomyia yanbarensis]
MSERKKKEKESEFKPLVKQSRKPYCIEGWLLYIAGTTMLWKELQESFGYSFLRTRNLSQDCLEHFFSLVRWKHVNNNHPDALQFMSAYKSIVINQLILPKNIGNVEADLSKFIVNSEEIQQIGFVQKQHIRGKYEPEKDVEPMNIYDPNQLSSIHWTTGWACSTVKHQECLIRMTANPEEISDEVTILSDLKRYNSTSRIMTPGEKIFKFFQGVCRVFDNHFESLLKLGPVGVKAELVDIIEDRFGFPTIERAESNNIYDEDDFILDESEKRVMEVMCVSCALKIINKYLNMLIGCRLANMNCSFKIKNDNKKTKNKAKKLNIARTSQLMSRY